jgi:hypothetical protein
MSSRSVGLVAVAAALLGCLTLAVAEAADWILKDRKGTSYNITQLRKKLGYESMVERLAYETKNAERRVPAPKESKETWQRLETMEKSLDPEDLFLGKFGSSSQAGARTRSLAILHTKEVEEFVNRPGFGMVRRPGYDPSPRLWELPAVDPITLKKAGKEDDQASAGVVLPPKDEEAYRGMRWPAVPSLLTFHTGSMYNFINSVGFGHIKDREHVAGFVSHHFRSMPEYIEPQPAEKKQPAAPKVKERWVISRLELVSLLKHDKPAVYLSDSLPRMQDLKKVKTRPLSDFEDSALLSLGKGEDLVAEASTNRIAMLGSIRAGNQCLKCHDVKRGDLLGSFSYELRRDPPLEVKK